jgi:ribose-phosphate pyrophosphokinase
MSTRIINCRSGMNYGIPSTIKIENTAHKNKEISVQIKESIRGEDVIVIQSFSNINNDFVELLLTCDAVERAGAASCTVIIPYFPYSRMDKRHRAGHPISARVICDCLRVVGVSRIISFDLHADQIEGFVGRGILFDHVPCTAFMTAKLKEHYIDMSDWVFCSPDAGAVKRTKYMAELNGSNDLCIIVKTRVKDGEVNNMQTIGDVTGRKVVLIDDMIDSGGTLNKAMCMLKEKGANHVIGVATHGIFSEPAKIILKGQELHVTDSVPNLGVPIGTSVYHLKPFIEEIINRVSNKERLSSLFYEWSV